MFFDVFGQFWSVSDLGFGLGNNPRRQVFEETGIWRLHYGEEHHLSEPLAAWSWAQATAAARMGITTALFGFDGPVLPMCICRSSLKQLSGLEC